MKASEFAVDSGLGAPGSSEERTVAVYGMGFVGLTLAATLASVGIPVVGVDSNPDVIAKLRKNEATFYEKGLDELLRSLEASNPMRLAAAAGEHASDIHIVSVGTPVGEDNRPGMAQLNAIARALAKHLKRGDLVVLRSTVPVGTTRRHVIPLLESNGLVAGSDFHVAFAPERTAEGNALHELRKLPQIVGGLDAKSVAMARRLFARIAGSIVEVPSLEAAELVKLLNNTFRDLVFSFANEAAQICDALNLDAFELIAAANKDYPRNPIPSPSPGVAGTCLSKDPYLYSHPTIDMTVKPALGLASRKINSMGADYVLAMLERFCRLTNRNLGDLKILLVGLAFKGKPETSDHRGSVALDLLQRLPSPANVTVKDFVIANPEILALGFEPVIDLFDAASKADAVIVMNNHVKNNGFDVAAAFAGKRPRLLFDGWHMFKKDDIERIDGAYYATMGYMTPGARS